MNTKCLECSRLFQESNDALQSHKLMLGRIYRAHYDPAMLWKLEPDVREAANLRRLTREALGDHQTICH
jgi:hypothetical protein